MLPLSVHWEKENTEIFQGLFDTWSELVSTCQEPKHPHGPPVRVGIRRSSNKWSQVKSLFTVYHLELQTYAIVIPQQLGVKLGLNSFFLHHGKKKSSFIMSLVSRKWVIILERAHWRPLNRSSGWDIKPKTVSHYEWDSQDECPL